MAARGRIAAGLFLALVDIHRFHGGFPRAFVHPVVLLTVLLALHHRHLRAALAAGAGALLYPPAGLLAVGVLLVSAVRRHDRRLRLDRRRAAFALLALAVFAAAVLGPQLAAGGAPRVLTAAEARGYPEFGAHGPLHFFVPSTIEYLKQNRSGFDLRADGSILALAALALLLFRPANLRLLREEALALPVVALGAYAVAQAVLFELYLPHRYTYPLVAFFAIAVGVTIRPTWMALWARPRPRLRAFALLSAPFAVAATALYVFPLGPTRRTRGRRSRSPPPGWSRPPRSPRPRPPRPRDRRLVTGLTLIGLLLAGSDGLARGSPCPTRPVTRHLATLPKDAVIAGDPRDLKCLPATTRRAVVISTQLAPAYETEYFLAGRARMFATLRAYYGQTSPAIADPDALRRHGSVGAARRRAAGSMQGAAAGGAPRSCRTGGTSELVHTAASPPSSSCHAACLRWRRGADEVYDIRASAARMREGHPEWGPTGSSLARSWTTSRARSTAPTG